jgi:HSP20 family molecular chaperone IbpA
MKVKVKQVAVITLSLVLGALGMWAYQEYRRPVQAPVESVLNDMFSDRFFRHSRDPFKEMDRLQKEMDRHFMPDNFSSLFDGWFSREYGDLPVSTIRMEEDDEHVYYKLETGEQDVSETNVSVAGTMVTFTAKLTTHSGSGSSTSSISQRFPVPAGVEPMSATISVQDEEIVVQFDKSG